MSLAMMDSYRLRLLTLGLVVGACSNDAHVVRSTAVDAGADADRHEVGDAAAGEPDLILTFSPESIDVETDPALDGRGRFSLQLFDTPAPAAGAAPLYAETLPRAWQSGEELAVSALPAVAVVLPRPIDVVYVRALFFDGPIPRAGAGSLGPGTWLGGTDLSNGFSRTSTMTPVHLLRRGMTYAVPLVAMRRVAVTVTSSVTPLGDGEGSLSVTFSRVAALPPAAATYGYGIEPCVDLKRGPATIDVAVVGSGEFYVAGFFDDLGIQTPGRTPPGTLLSVRDPDVVAGTGEFDRTTLAPAQYSGEITIDLGYVVPLPVDAGVPGPNSCRDLGYVVGGDE
jgi:hypothetical protein